jgi:hypothetical protein
MFSWDAQKAISNYETRNTVFHLRKQQQYLAIRKL